MGFFLNCLYLYLLPIPITRIFFPDLIDTYVLWLLLTFFKSTLNVITYSSKAQEERASTSDQPTTGKKQPGRGKNVNILVPANHEKASCFMLR